MSVTTTSYTTNTKKITISNEFGNGSTNIIAAVNSAITGAGWTAWDTITTTLFNPMVTRVYRVLNVDGVTYKYLILRWDTIKTQLFTSCCEFWNTTTKIPTNESWTNAGAFAQGYDIANGFFLVNATARNFMIWTWINNRPGLWTAVVEFERVAPEDLATVATDPVPCFAWTSSVTIGTTYGNFGSVNTRSPYMFAFPRTFDGSVGPQAAVMYAPVTNRGMMPPNYSASALTITTDTANNFGHMGMYHYNLTYGWNTAGTPASTISVDTGTAGIGRTTVAASNYLMPFGRMYNFGVTGPIGRLGDTTLANIDATAGWPSSTTSQTECLLLPMNGGNEGSTSTIYNQYTYGAPFTGTYSYTFANVGPSALPMKAISIGDTVYMATGNGAAFSATYANTGGIQTYSLSGGTGQTPVFRVNVGSNSGGISSSISPYGGVYDIMFDGNSYIYATTANGIMRMDANSFTTTFFTSNQTLANGCAYLSMDNKNIYASSRTANARPQVYTIDRATGNVFFGNTYTPAGSASQVSIWGTPVPDYTGNVYAHLLNTTQTGSQAWVATFSANTGGNVASPAGIQGNLWYNAGVVQNLGITTTHNPGAATGLYYDYISGRLWSLYALSSSGTFIVYEMYALQGAASALLSQSPGHFSGNLGTLTYNAVPMATTSLSTGSTTTVQLWMGGLGESNAMNNKGELHVIPWKGMHLMGIRKNASVDHRVANNTGQNVFLKFIDGNFTGGANIGGPTGTGITHNTARGAASCVIDNPALPSPMLTTNGVTLLSCFNETTGNFAGNRLLMITGMYTASNNIGLQMSRLLLKG
jgi:hypothetical protein